MSKIIYIFGIMFIALIISSCEEEFEPGATEAFDYSGDWYYQLQLEDGTVLGDFDYHGDMLLTYNTADNTSNEVWFDDPGYLFFKSKFQLNGSQESFSGATPALNLYEIGLPSDFPKVDGAEHKDTIAYGEVELLEGKILEDAAKVYADMQNAPSDSIYLKLQFNSVVYTYLIDMNVSGSDTTYTPIQQGDFESLEDFEIYVASGHRQTGWEVYL